MEIMKANMIGKRLMAFFTTLTAVSLLLTGSIRAQVVQPQPTPPGTWTLIGTTVANFSADHDTIIVRGPFDDFSKILFKVTEAALNLHHLVVTYDNGESHEIRVRQKIPKGDKSRVIDLPNGGIRSIRRIDFWYDTRDSSGTRAEVTVYGKR